MTNCDLYRYIKEELKNGSSDLVTRQSGHVIRERIENDINKLDDKTVVSLDFTSIGIVDYSCADEIIAKLVSRLLSDEYGDIYIILKGLNSNQKENIEVALERKGLAVIAEMRDGTRQVVGSLNNYLLETLHLIMNKGKLTAKDLSSDMGLEANTSGTRLLNLHKKRLVRRTEDTGIKGRVWIYENL